MTQRTWLRLYTDICTDADIAALTPAQRWIWIALLCAGRLSDKPGYIDVSKPGAYHELAAMAGVSVSVLRTTLREFARRQLIVLNDTSLYFMHWSAPQREDRENVKERVKKHRANKKTAEPISESHPEPQTVEARTTDISVEQQIEEDTKRFLEQLNGKPTEAMLKLEEYVDELEEVREFWDRNFYPMRPYDMEVLGQYVDDGMAPEVILHACKLAHEAGKRTLGYVQGILRTYVSANVKTIVEAEYVDSERRRYFKRKTEEPMQRPKPNITIHSEEYRQRMEQLNKQLEETFKEV